MLSYQHGFHAGNVADVLKHTVLCYVLDYLLQKEKPLYFHDMHAGRGLYDLTHPIAQKTGEYREGIEKLWRTASSAPAALMPYFQALRAFNEGDHLRYYAGSLLLAQQMLRSSDRLFASELHPQEYAALAENCKHFSNVRVQKTEAYAALKAALPPKERRGVVLLDPSYETMGEDAAIVSALDEALRRFATGVYLIWYPVVDAVRSEKMIKKISALPMKSLLKIEWLTREPNGTGMAGSGMLVINPPWPLAAAMREALPWLAKTLSPETGSYCVDFLVEAA